MEVGIAYTKALFTNPYTWENFCLTLLCLVNAVYLQDAKVLKFIYSEKATKFCKIHPKLTVEILQNFMSFSEYMSFN